MLELPGPGWWDLGNSSGDRSLLSPSTLAIGCDSDFPQDFPRPEEAVLVLEASTAGTRPRPARLTPLESPAAWCGDFH